MYELANPNHARSPAGKPQDIKADLQALIPFLRAFAHSLCRHADFADDLAQDALLKAWRARDSYTPGTNLKAWVFTILRNEFYSSQRRAWRQIPWDQDAAEQRRDAEDQQLWSSELSDTVRALHCLADEQREALVLIAAGGFSYEDAAKICQCAVGTVKSRVSRARRNLIAILDDQATPLAGSTSPGRNATYTLMAELEELTSRRRGLRAELPHDQHQLAG